MFWLLEDDWVPAHENEFKIYNSTRRDVAVSLLRCFLPSDIFFGKHCLLWLRTNETVDCEKYVLYNFT